MTRQTETPGCTTDDGDDSNDKELPIESVQDMLSWRNDYSLVTGHHPYIDKSVDAYTRKQGRHYDLQRP